MNYMDYRNKNNYTAGNQGAQKQLYPTEPVTLKNSNEMFKVADIIQLPSKDNQFSMFDQPFNDSITDPNRGGLLHQTKMKKVSASPKKLYRNGPPDSFSDLSK